MRRYTISFFIHTYQLAIMTLVTIAICIMNFEFNSIQNFYKFCLIGPLASFSELHTSEETSLDKKFFFWVRKNGNVDFMTFFNLLWAKRARHSSSFHLFIQVVFLRKFFFREIDLIIADQYIVLFVQKNIYFSLKWNMCVHVSLRLLRVSCIIGLIITTTITFLQ